jgi:hypothetical protein
MYDFKICIEAIAAEKAHAEIGKSKKPRHCNCTSCDPEVWPHNIEEQLAEYAENNGPGTIPVDM